MSARRTAYRQLAAHVGTSASSNRVGFDNQVIRRIVQGETRHDVRCVGESLGVHSVGWRWEFALPARRRFSPVSISTASL
jgi:hypothetical protein